MIRRLRAKLVAIIMAFVTVILVCVMTAVLGLTRATLERESLDMMRLIALDPIQAPAPGEEFDGVRLPYFVLSVAEDGTIEPAGGGGSCGQRRTKRHAGRFAPAVSAAGNGQRELYRIR